MAHKWADSLHNPSTLGGPHRLRVGDKIKNELTGFRGSPKLQSAGENHKSPRNGQIGYITPTVWGVPTASKHRKKSGVVLLHNTCRPQACQRFKAGEKIRSGPIGYIILACCGVPTAS